MYAMVAYCIFSSPGEGVKSARGVIVILVANVFCLHVLKTILRLKNFRHRCERQATLKFKF